MAVVAGLSTIPIVGGPLSVVADELFERRRQRVAQLGSELLIDHDTENVLDRLRTDERFGELFVRAADTVAVTWWAPKRTAMRKVVRAVLDGDDAVVDDSELLLLALERLDAPHFAALQRLTTQAADLEEDKVGVSASAVAGMSAPVLAALLSVGAVSQQSGWGGLFYRPTDLGARLLALVTY